MTFKRQQGIAILQVVGIIAVLLSIFGVIAAKQVRLQAKMQATDQLIQLQLIANSAEQIVLWELDVNRKDKQALVGTFPLVVEQDDPIEVLDANISYSIEQLDGKLNLNWLHKKHISQFDANLLEVMTAVAPDLFAAGIKNVNSWIDSEDTLDLSVAYSDEFIRSALELVDLTELLLLDDYSANLEQAKQYKALLSPHFVMLPKESKLNINAINESSTKLIHADIADSELMKVLAAVDFEKGAGVADFSALETLLAAALQPPANNQAQTDATPQAIIELKRDNFIFRSEYFKATILIDWALDEDSNIKRQYEVFIHRPIDQTKPIRIYRRQLLSYAG